MKRHAHTGHALGRWAAALFLLAMSASVWADEEITVRAVAEKDEAYLGESFLYQIQAHGTNDVMEPDLRQLPGFSTEFLGGQPHNTTQTVSVNGRTQTFVSRSFVYTWRLTPKAQGKLVIPAVRVDVAGKHYMTPPIAIQVSEPTATRHFKLGLSLSEDTCYVGEPVELTVTWYLSQGPRNWYLSVPFLANTAFRVATPEVVKQPGREYYEAPLGKDQVTLERGVGRYDGVPYTTLSFRKILVPKRSGTFELAGATISFEAPDDSVRRRTTRRGPFDDAFFDGFFDRQVFRRFVVGADPLTLTVRDLPAEGRPEDFSGLVGAYDVTTQATPTDVNVGDPITLSVTVGGTPYPECVGLPSLRKQKALAADFKIPAEMADGAVENGVKVFTQTIRATRSDITEIPPIALSYFDTETNRYAEARSRAIPLTVHETKVVTAADAEGLQPVSVKRTSLEIAQGGIAHNYGGPSALVNQEYGLATFVRSPVWAAAVLVPFGAYLVLLVTTAAHRRRHANPEARRSRQAYGRFVRALAHLRRSHGRNLQSAVLEELRAYLGARLTLAPGALTWRDVEPHLRRRGVKPQTLTTLDDLFRECEAGHYAGTAEASADADSLPQRAVRLVKDIDRRLR